MKEPEITIKRTYRKLSPEESEKMRRAIEEEEAAIPENSRRVRRLIAEWQRLHDLIDALAAEQQRQGMESVELARRAGMDPSNLSRLLHNRDANPTVSTLQRLAEALGKEVRIELVDRLDEAA